MYEALILCEAITDPLDESLSCTSRTHGWWGTSPRASGMFSSLNRTGPTTTWKAGTTV